MLKAIMVRLMKGEAAMRVAVWQGHVKVERQKHHERMLEKMRRAQMDAQHESACSMLKSFMVRLMKGEAAMRLSIWASRVKIERQKQHEKMLATMDKKRADAQHDHACRIMKQIVVRMVRGESSMRLDIWAQATRDYREEQRRRMVLRLEKQAEDAELQGRQNSGCSLLKQCMARIVHGEIGERLEIWREMVRFEAVSRQQALLREMEKKSGDMRHDTACKILKHVMISLIKGETAALLDMWGDKVQSHKHQAVLDEVERQMTESRQNTACNILKQVVARLVHGEIGMRLEVWKHETMLAQHEREKADLARMLELKLTEEKAQTAVQLLSQIMIRLVKGETAMRLAVWRQHKIHETEMRHQEALVRLEKARLEAQGGTAVDMLRQILTRFVKGEASYRLELWRQANKRDIEMKHHTVLLLMEQKRLDLQTQTGYNLLRAILTRILKGRAGYHLELWRQKKQHDFEEKQRQVYWELEQRRRQGEANTACNLLAQILNRLTRGRVGMRLELWRQHKKKAMESQHLELLHALERHHLDVSHSLGVKLLKQIMVRLTRGVISMRLEVWRQQAEQQKTEDEQNRATTEQTRLLHESIHRATEDANLRHTGCFGVLQRHLAEFKEKYAKAVVTMRIEIWRQQTKRHQTRITLHQRVATLLGENGLLRGRLKKLAGAAVMPFNSPVPGILVDSMLEADAVRHTQQHQPYPTPGMMMVDSTLAGSPMPMHDSPFVGRSLELRPPPSAFGHSLASLYAGATSGVEWHDEGEADAARQLAGDRLERLRGILS